MCMPVLLLPLFLLMQVRIAAHDDIYPRAVATATVEVTMLRNENRPTWSHETPLRLTLNEREPLGYVVTDVPEATDLDGVSLSLSSFLFPHWNI